LLDPVTASCGHSFDIGCFEHLRCMAVQAKRELLCPVCRKGLSTSPLQPALALRELIELCYADAVTKRREERDAEYCKMTDTCSENVVDLTADGAEDGSVNSASAIVEDTFVLGRFGQAVDEVDLTTTSTEIGVGGEMTTLLYRNVFDDGRGTSQSDHDQEWRSHSVSPAHDNVRFTALYRHVYSDGVAVSPNSFVQPHVGWSEADGFEIGEDPADHPQPEASSSRNIISRGMATNFQTTRRHGFKVRANSGGFERKTLPGSTIDS